MDNAQKYTNIITYPDPSKFNPKESEFEGVPTIEVTKGGRIFAGWFAGGYQEPNIDNYNYLVFSDDNGETWSDPVFVSISSPEKGFHTFDIQIQIDDDNILHIFWAQKPATQDKFNEGIKTGNLRLCDGAISGWHFDWDKCFTWEVTCPNPDDKVLTFTEPRFLFTGLYRNKWTDLSNGDRIFCASESTQAERYMYYISHDKGKTFEKHYGGNRYYTCFDEAMVYEMKDKIWKFIARSAIGSIAVCYSKDFGKTWSETHKDTIPIPETRTYLGKTPKGNALLVYNDNCSVRENMTIALSTDDSNTWKYKKNIDTRYNVSYPDVAYYKDKIYLIYDRERQRAKEIIMAIFTENDIINGNDIKIKVINK